MEEQAKLLANLASMISSMNAKLDEMLPAVLSWKPETEGSAEWLSAEVGGVRAPVIDISPPTSAFPKVKLPPPLPHPTDVRDTCSFKPAVSDPARGENVHGQLGHHDASSLREGLPETIPRSAELQGSSSSASTQTLGVHSSECTGFITTARATCSSDGLPHYIVTAPVPVAFSPPTTTKYGLDTNCIDVAAGPLATTGMFRSVLAPMSSTPTAQWQQLHNDCEFSWVSSSQRITNKFHVHRPMPWPSFLIVQATGDETRPLPWPSFRVPYEGESPSDAVMEPSRHCGSSDVSHSTSCAAIEFPILGCSGNTFISHGCIIIHDMCYSTDWRCLDEVILFLAYWCCTINCMQSVYITLGRHPGSVSGFSLGVIFRSSKLRLFSHGYASVSLLSICWVIISSDSQRSITLTDRGSSSIANVVMLIFCGKTHGIGFLLHRCTCADSSSLVSCKAGIHNLQDKVQMQLMWLEPAFVLLGEKSCWNWQCAHPAIGQGALLILIQFDVWKNMDLWWVTTAILTPRVATAILTPIVRIFSPVFSVEMKANFSVQPGMLFPYSYHLRIWAPAIFSFAWGNVDCMSNSGTASCSLQVTYSVFIAWFSLQMGIACPARPKVLLTHAYQLTWDSSDGSCCGVTISLNMHRTMSLADRGCLCWGADQAVFYKTGPIHFGWTNSTAIYLSGYDAGYNKHGWELDRGIYLRGHVREANPVAGLMICSRLNTMNCTLFSARGDPGDVLVHHAISASEPCITMSYVQETIALLQQHLPRAQQHMKSVADRKRSHHVFAVDDWVIQRVGGTSYNLRLLESCRLHSVITVSQLFRAVPPMAEVIRVLPVLSSWPPDPVHILETCLYQHGGDAKMHVLVQWLAQPVELATWEDQGELQHRFLDAPAWGQAASQPRGSVTHRDCTVPLLRRCTLRQVTKATKMGRSYAAAKEAVGPTPRTSKAHCRSGALHYKREEERRRKASMNL